MRRPGTPLFLGKSGYRRRRLHDAARLVTVFGLFLFFLPILWEPSQTTTRDTTAVGLYLFGIWAALILLAAALAPALRRTAPPDRDRDAGDQG